MSKHIFIWVAHPKPGSLNAALADHYATGAKAQGATVRTMALSDMDISDTFDGYDNQAALPADIATWQDNIRWADHVLIVHPYWWGAMPSKAKAVLDAGLQPGFGFKYHARGVKWDKLLTGKTGDAIITSDTPPWIDTLMYRSPGRRVMRNQVMKFTGLKPRKVIQLGSVKLADSARIDRWLRQAQDMGTAAA